VWRQELNGEIVFIPRDPFNAATVRQSGAQFSVSRIEISIGKQNGITNGLSRTVLCVRGKIGGVKTTFAADHVAIRAVAFAEEYFLAVRWVANRSRGRCIALKGAKVGYQRAEGVPTEVVERGHRFSRHALLQNL